MRWLVKMIARQLIGLSFITTQAKQEITKRLKAQRKKLDFIDFDRRLVGQREELLRRWWWVERAGKAIRVMIAHDSLSTSVEYE